MSQRYGVLPSDLLRSADSLDYMVFDVASTYTQYKTEQAQGKVPQHMYNQEDLQEAFNRGKEKVYGKTNSK